MRDSLSAIAVGERVYVRHLDVFGRVQGVESFGTYVVECEWPMPHYTWRGQRSELRLASEVE